MGSGSDKLGASVSCTITPYCIGLWQCGRRLAWTCRRLDCGCGPTICESRVLGAISFSKLTNWTTNPHAQTTRKPKIAQRPILCSKNCILKATFSKIEPRYDTELLLYCVVAGPLFRVTGFNHPLLATQKSTVIAKFRPA